MVFACGCKTTEESPFEIAILLRPTETNDVSRVHGANETDNGESYLLEVDEFRWYENRKIPWRHLVAVCGAGADMNASLPLGDVPDPEGKRGSIVIANATGSVGICTFSMTNVNKKIVFSFRARIQTDRRDCAKAPANTGTVLVAP